MIAWPLIDPPTWGDATTVDRTDNAYLLWMALIFFVGAMIPALIVPLLTRKRAPHAPVTHTQTEAITYAVMLTVLVSAATYYEIGRAHV